MDTDSSMPAGEINRDYYCSQCGSDTSPDEVATLRDALAADPHESEKELAATIVALRADAVKRASELHTWKETATTLRAERDELAQITREDARQMEDQLAEVAALRAEVERMRPVVVKAIKYKHADGGWDADERCRELFDAVDAFCAAQQETTEGECPSCGAQVDEPACANPKCVGRKF